MSMVSPTAAPRQTHDAFADVSSHLRDNRPAALAALAARFPGGVAPAIAMAGAHPGVILAATIHPWLDALAALVGPHPLRWQGKTFADGGGENLWWHRADLPGLLLAATGRLCGWHARLVTDSIYCAVPFHATHAPSVADAALTVLRIDYDVPENPAFIRRIHDELVDAGDGLLLGRGYYRFGERQWPWVWFALHVPGDLIAAGTDDATGSHDARTATDTI